MKPPRPPFIPHVPFDLVLAEPCFPPVKAPQTEQEEAFQAVRLTFLNYISSRSVLVNTRVGHRGMVGGGPPS